MNYLRGFGNFHQSELIPNSLPVGQNSPQQCEYGLYAEQISGSAFTAPGSKNLRSWLYRVRPSVAHIRNRSTVNFPRWCSDSSNAITVFEPLRWAEFDQEGAMNWVQALRTISITGSSESNNGAAIAVTSVSNSSQPLFNNNDAEMLLLPISEGLKIQTELGWLDVPHGYVAVIPKGLTFQLSANQWVSLYVLENYGSPFELPCRGAIGANGLANERDFEYPVACIDENAPSGHLITKRNGCFVESELAHSPFDVVAWHGNFGPYRYDLDRFNSLGSISFDHPDPSIFTVLTSPSNQAGVANCDFVIFSDRWLVAEHTFRPPYYHRNVMSEFMGLLRGRYDAKPGGFVKGGASLHVSGVAHGPDAEAYNREITRDEVPQKLSDTMAFMFETSGVQKVTEFALKTKCRDKNYATCWSDLPSAKI